MANIARVPLRVYIAGLAALFVIAAGGGGERARAGTRRRIEDAQADARFAARLAAREIIDKPCAEAALLERPRALLASPASP